MPRINPRTRTGCLPCRRRKKKCDEEKLQYLACTRNKLQYAWPPHIVHIFGLDAEQTRDSDDLHGRKGLGNPIDAQSNNSLPIPSTATATKDPIVTPEGAEQTSERENGVVSWSLEPKSVLSTVQAGMLLPESPLLMSHYLEDTAPKLAPAPGIPWVSWILPVAYNDDLLMNVILALSGGRLLYKLPNNQEIHHASHRHYSSAVQTLYEAFNDQRMLSKPLTLLRVALTILILVVSGNMDGSPSIHLRALRQLILNLRSKPRQSMSAAEQKLYGFVMELYSYIVLCNSITRFDMNCNRTVTYDSFLQTFDDLQDLGAFGVMFSGGHHLFELISSVSLFAAQDPNIDRHEEYRYLKARIDVLEPPLPKEPDTHLRPGCGATLEHLQPLLDVAVLNLPRILPSNYSCILMWPIMIIGSLWDEEHSSSSRKVIVSIPTSLYHNITFNPPLPEKKVILSENTTTGYYSKMIYVFDEPWWHKAGFSGVLDSEKGPILFSRDTSISQDNQWSITCFLVGDKGRNWSKLPQASRHRQAWEQFSQSFGKLTEVPRPANTLEMEWTKEAFFLESSREWRGYMEGAINSGLQGGAEVVKGLEDTASRL
ncbi:uncharacterized protein KD926_004714 [Aspergillus affinis]|uniref:uncharacterized protein n=1 Tax=Aspergillus affinis TaxID=1070780 RepID=UPI0022FE1E9C|nr:uncharacterized protein KD926_004714 [Aspergillus affinis]KAI9042924.1 hypothetical protein KD926_004714 [Aspergillus affinis]